MVTQRGLGSLGEALRVAAPDFKSDSVVGDLVNRALKAALKATVLGDQSDQQIEKELTKARKAFVRQLRRMA